MDALLRSYLGIRMPEALWPVINQAKLEVRRRIPSEPIRWIDEGGYALILAVLGEQPLETLVRVGQAITPICRRYQPLTLSLQGWMGIPNGVQPKSPAVALGGDTRLVLQLQEDLKSGFSAIVEPREKTLAPHILLGSLRTESHEKRTALGQAMRHMKGEVMATFQMNRVEILHTIADENHGVRYRSLAEVPLSQS